MCIMSVCTSNCCIYNFVYPVADSADILGIPCIMKDPLELPHTGNSTCSFTSKPEDLVYACYGLHDVHHVGNLAAIINKTIQSKLCIFIIVLEETVSNSL